MYSLENFMILGTNYKKDKVSKKVSESLYTKEKRSLLNTQEKSVLLNQFSWVGSPARINQVYEIKIFAKAANVLKPMALFEKISFFIAFWSVFSSYTAVSLITNFKFSLTFLWSVYIVSISNELLYKTFYCAF